MINNYRTALRLLAIAMVGFAATAILMAGSHEDMTWGEAGDFSSDSYAQSIMDRHDNCSTGDDHPDTYPTGAVLTLWGDVAPHYTNNPKRVDAALDFALGKNDHRFFSVTAFCY
jgi:hypothetical protein